MSAATKLTLRQEQVLDFIRDHVAAKGFAPTLREIGFHLKIGSTNGVTDHLLALERKGYIRRDQSKARSLVVIHNDSDAGVTPIVPTASDACQMFIGAAKIMAQRQQLTQEEVLACGVVLDSERCRTFASAIAELARHHGLSRQEIVACCRAVVSV